MRGFQPHPFFYPPLEPACPLFLKFLFPPIFIIDTFPYPHADNPFFALVRNTNLPDTHRFIFIQLRMTFIPKIMMAGKSFSTKILRNALEVHLLYFGIIHMHTQYFCLTVEKGIWVSMWLGYLYTNIKKTKTLLTLLWLLYVKLILNYLHLTHCFRSFCSVTQELFLLYCYLFSPENLLKCFWREN